MLQLLLLTLLVACSLPQNSFSAAVSSTRISSSSSSSSTSSMSNVLAALASRSQARGAQAVLQETTPFPDTLAKIIIEYTGEIYRLAATYDLPSYELLTKTSYCYMLVINGKIYLQDMERNLYSCDFTSNPCLIAPAILPWLNKNTKILAVMPCNNPRTQSDVAVVVQDTMESTGSINFFNFSTGEKVLFSNPISLGKGSAVVSKHHPVHRLVIPATASCELLCYDQATKMVTRYKFNPDQPNSFSTYNEVVDFHSPSLGFLGDNQWLVIPLKESIAEPHKVELWKITHTDTTKTVIPFELPDEIQPAYSNGGGALPIHASDTARYIFAVTRPNLNPTFTRKHTAPQQQTSGTKVQFVRGPISTPPHSYSRPSNHVVIYKAPHIAPDATTQEAPTLRAIQALPIAGHITRVATVDNVMFVLYTTGKDHQQQKIGVFVR